MKKFNPKVTIVIPVYNGSNFLGEAIDSALAQTYNNIEIVVVNDGSSDDGATHKIAQSYGDKIRYYEKPNGGVATALNYAIDKMEGEYFSWLSHDDLYETTKIADQVNVLHSLEDAKDVIVACNAKALYASGIKKEERIDKDTFKYVDIFLATSAVVGVNGCALLIPKKALVDEGGFDTSLPATQDYDMWFRLKENYRYVLLEKSLVISRRHDQQDGVKKYKLAFEASDKLHYDFLKSIPFERYEKFFSETGGNTDKYWENYTVYKVNGYTKTAAMMLKYLLMYYFQHDKARYEEMMHSEIGSVAKQELTVGAKSKHRVLFFNNVWHRGGIERVLSAIFNSQLADTYEFVLVTCDGGPENDAGYPLSEKITHIKIHNTNMMAELMDLVSLFEIDLFVGNPNHSEVFLDMYGLLKSVGIKSVAYNHGHYLLPYTTGEYLYPVALKLKEAYRSVDAVIWLSEIACSLYNIEASNGVYIPNPVKIDERVKPKTRSAKTVLAVGRFDDEVKRIDKILLVFKELYEVDSEYHLDVVGYCPMEYKMPWREDQTIEAFVEEQNIPIEGVTFHGEQKDVSKFYDTAGFLILASRSEGFALVLTEALARGAPCACFDYLGVEEIVQNGYNGWVASQDDYAGLADKILTTIDNDQLFAKMSQNAIESVKQFETSIFYNKWGTLIKALLDSDNIGDAKLLKPTSGLTSGDYEKVIVQYQHILNDTLEHYLNRPPVIIYQTQQPQQKKSRFKDIETRLKLSLERDGVYLTIEKVIRKIYKKLSKLVR